MAKSCVIMSIYCGDKVDYFRRSIQSIDFSVISQVFLGVDGPIDEDLRYLVRGLDDSRFKVVWFTQNRGLSFVLNELLSRAIEDKQYFNYFFRLDADDICYPARFSVQLETMEASPNIGVLGSNVTVINEDNVAIGELQRSELHSKLAREICFNSPFVHPTVVFRRQVVEQFRYPTDTVLFEDVKLWFILAKSGVVFSNVQQPLLFFRETPATVSRRGGLKKSIDELLVRLEIIRGGAGFSLLILLKVLAIFFSKVLLPHRVQSALRYRRLKKHSN